jgi:hypothetical protein
MKKEDLLLKANKINLERYAEELGIKAIKGMTKNVLLNKILEADKLNNLINSNYNSSYNDNNDDDDVLIESGLSKQSEPELTLDTINKEEFAKKITEEVFDRVTELIFAFNKYIQKPSKEEVFEIVKELIYSNLRTDPKFIADKIIKQYNINIQKYGETFGVIPKNKNYKNELEKTQEIKKLELEDEIKEEEKKERIRRLENEKKEKERKERIKNLED